jgi:S-adenosylmethionine:tRNA ribosyltransferase-isomerase
LLIMNISDYDYTLPDERIAKFPPERREDSQLLIWRGGELSHTRFGGIGGVLPADTLLVFNDTRVVRARIVMHKPDGGARVEVFCLEPHEPADYERAFAARGECRWKCMIGNAKKWKAGAVEADNLLAFREMDDVVRFEWGGEETFGEVLERLGRVPIPPYLNRESAEIDGERYQTVFARVEGSVAAPTAGLHFTDNLIDSLREKGVTTERVTLHVGAGTFLPVKVDDPREHAMHTEHFEVTAELLDSLIAHKGRVTAVGTTTVRTLESLIALGNRVLRDGAPDAERPVGQWEPYGEMGDGALEALRDFMRANGVEKLKAATQIMIMPGFRFRVTDVIITNFHQPRSTLLLLVSAFVGGRWREIYDYALGHGFRFLSYGDSSILFR